ncbi:site-2 protease family protein [Candidatus Woesearchaeota archaeon]|nr:site-2 protease family protein [Candidatus Woesearchaeota archaeon]
MNIDAFAFATLVLILSVFVYRHRKDIEVVPVIKPVMSFYMYRTTIGLDLMDSIANRWGWMLVRLESAIVGVGFAGMAFVSFEMVRNLVVSLTNPSAISGAALVLPIQAKGVFYVPFFYWIIAILVVVCIHEFCHGLWSRVAGIRVLASGFAFLSILLPVIPAAFVEPNEKKLAKQSAKAQLSVFAAGPVSNLVFGLLLMVLSLSITRLVIDPMHSLEGVTIQGFHADQNYAIHTSGMSVGERIVGIDSTDIRKTADLSAALEGKKPGDGVIVRTNRAHYPLTLGTNPADATKPYLGVLIKQYKELTDPNLGKEILVWLDGLLFWVFVLSLGVGFFNLLPLGIVDGGRMFHTLAAMYMPRERAAKVYHAVSACFMIVIVGSLVINFIR